MLNLYGNPIFLRNAMQLRAARSYAATLPIGKLGGNIIASDLGRLLQIRGNNLSHQAFLDRMKQERWNLKMQNKALEKEQKAADLGIWLGTSTSILSALEGRRRAKEISKQTAAQTAFYNKLMKYL